jgi:hypothetical protein
MFTISKRHPWAHAQGYNDSLRRAAQNGSRNPTKKPAGAQDAGWLKSR